MLVSLRFPPFDREQMKTRIQRRGSGGKSVFDRECLRNQKDKQKFSFFAFLRSLIGFKVAFGIKRGKKFAKGMYTGHPLRGELVPDSIFFYLQ